MGKGFKVPFMLTHLVVSKAGFRLAFSNPKCCGDRETWAQGFPKTPLGA